MKKIIILLTCLILLQGFQNGVISIHNNQKYQNNMIFSIDETVENLISNFDLEVITNGFGLTIEIRNDGAVDLLDILIEISYTGGYSIHLSETRFEIPFILAGQSIEFHVQSSGFGLGVLSDLPRIIVHGSAPHVHPVEKGIIAKIIGPIIITIDEFYDDPRSFDGYTLFTPEWYTNTYLINNDGEVVHSWSESNLLNGLGSFLLENGHMIRSALPWPNPTFLAGGILGRVEEFDWNGSRVWYFDYTNQDHCHHHGVEVLPNGNILMIAWEYKTRQEATQAGRNPDFLHGNELYPDHIIEVEPIYPNGGNIVWEWHVWDHLIQDFDPSKDNFGNVEEHPELIDINFGHPDADWNHINSVDYNEDLDQIMVSVKHLSELWVIDHSTSTEEAAGHTGGRYGKGGDLLYRWGNPHAYRQGGPEDQKLFNQHDPQWIKQGLPGEGNILIFNNGNGRPGGEYSSIEEIVPPVDELGFYHKHSFEAYGPKEALWTYTKENPFDFFSYHISGCQRLPNGNTLICEGANGLFFEVTLEKEIVWEYLNQFPSQFNNKVFKIHRYPPDYPGLKFLFE
ncbi:hypothetical protein B6U98_04580 [Thermoplasmatales archaeon ex4572_165]|nr:MAG: hypothetical protein B6U98_04580 [Thermoplasmatales archaeon ex4572_165]